MSDAPEPIVAEPMPDYPMVERNRGWLICTRKQAEAGKVKAEGQRIPHEGKIR